MKIYSWNMLYRNVKQDRAFEYISQLDFDVLCLQEVPEEFLHRLQKLPYHFASAVDIEFVKEKGARKRKESLYHVILSRHPMSNMGTFDMPPLIMPPRARLLVKLKEGIVEDFSGRKSLYADITLKQGLVRIFSLHLILSSPSDRKGEFDSLEPFLPQGFSAILAGDFNIVEFPAWKPINWLCGSSLAEAMPWHDERSEVEARFKKWGLQNPLRGKVTLNVSLSQLDHILVPQEWNVSRAEVIKNTYGSDHNPVSVETV